MEDLSPGCKRYPDYEIAVSFNILIPNKNAGALPRHSSSLFYYFLSLFVRLHITIATITRITPNISPADKVSLYSITPIRVAATGSTDAKIEAFPLFKFLRPAVYRQNASTVLKKTNNNDHPIIFILAQLTLITFSKLHKGITPIAATDRDVIVIALK